MPEFHLNADRRGSHLYYALSDFAKGYIEAMFFTNGDTGDDKRENHLNELGVERLTKTAVIDIAADCARFWSDNESLLTQASALDDYDESRAGNDFWFTRQGHGVGYWDRKELSVDDLGERLADAARKFGEAYVETWRGWIYHR